MIIFGGFNPPTSHESHPKGDSNVALLFFTRNTWVIDSGVTDHSSLITSLVYSSIKSVQIANGDTHVHYWGWKCLSFTYSFHVFGFTYPYFF